MRRPAVVASLLLAIAATTAAAQEPVLLRIGGQAGQSNKYRSVMEIFVRGGQLAAMMSPDTTLPMMRITTVSTRTLTSVAGDTLVYAEVIDSAGMESPAMPQMAAMAGAMTSQMIGQTVTSRMDVRGRIFSMETVNPNAAAMGGRGMPGMGGGGNRANMFVLPAGAVRVGESWNDSMMVAASGEEPATNMVATFKLERVDNRGGLRVGVVSINGTMVQNGPQGTVRFSISGEFQVDTSNRRIAGVNMTMLGTMNSPQMGETPVKMQLTQSLSP